jgi:hypothetical protein
MIAMGLAGASRVFTLMDEEPETDEGYVMLVHAKKDENGEIVDALMSAVAAEYEDAIKSLKRGQGNAAWKRT